jgi:hypothetical protein
MRTRYLYCERDAPAAFHREQRRSLTPKPSSSVVGEFREKYWAKDVKKYYSKFDVAVLVERVQSTVFRAKYSYKTKGVCGSDFLKASQASSPTHTSTPPKAATSNSVWADHALATDRRPNTDAR